MRRVTQGVECWARLGLSAMQSTPSTHVRIDLLWPRLHLSHPPAQGIKYTVFGLADSNYTRFAYVPRALRNRFGDLGAESVSVTGKGRVPVVKGIKASFPPLHSRSGFEMRGC